MNRIKILRENAGMQQKELAKHFNVAQNTVSSWENGKRDPDTETVVRIANFFGVSIDYVLGNSDIKKAPNSEEMDALTQKQRRIIELMGQMTPEQQDELVRQAQYQLWLKQQDKSDP